MREESIPLKKELSAPDLVAAGAGAILGSGIFIITGKVAATHAGPAIAISFLVAGFACLCSALCYAEFASVVPQSGSAYSYTRHVFGEPMAWLVFWCLILEYLLAAAVVAVGWSSYVVGFLGTFDLAILPALSAPPIKYEDDAWQATGAWLNLPAALVIIAMTVVVSLGVKLSAAANGVIVMVKVSVILLVIIAGALYVDPNNWKPFVPENLGRLGEFGWSGVIAGAGLVFFAFLGFDAVATLAQESQNPKRDIPIGILGSLFICMLLYIATSLVLTGLVPYQQLNVANPVFVAIESVGARLRWLGVAVNVGAIAGLTSVLMMVIIAQSRIIYAVASDGLLPKRLALIDPVRRTPILGTAVVGGLACLLASLFPLDILAQLISGGTLLIFGAVCFGILPLRRSAAAKPPSFRTPFYPLTPIVGMLVCGYLFISLPEAAILRVSAWVICGLVIYAMTKLLRRPRITR